MILAAFLLPLQTSHPFALRQAIFLGSLVTILFATKASFGIIFQTELVMQRLAAADIVASLLTLFISWFLIKQGLGFLALIGAVVIANFFAVLVALILARKTIKFNFYWDKIFVKKLFKEALPMGAILLIFTVDNKIDTIMLGSLKGSGAVGIYAVAYRVYDVLILGAAFLMNALLPVLSEYSDLKKWRLKLQEIYQKVFDILLLMAVGVVLATWFLAPLVVWLITQQRFAEFGDAISVLRLLSLALFLAYFNHLTGYTVVALGRQRKYFWVALSALLFNVIANLIFIPRFSYFGAAAVTILTESLVLIITTIFIFRLIKIVPSLSQFPKTAIQLVKNKGKIF